jgi:predicted phage terminase large subunit-like protein
MRAISIDEVTERAWRLNVPDFAERVSDGKWVAYDWLENMLAIVQEAILAGDARIIVNAPPRHGKSEAISHWLPAWFLEWFPARNVILASYSDTYATRWGLAVRDEFVSQKKTCTRIRSDKSAAKDWQTASGGGMRSVGVGGSVTGIGGDLIVVDDPHKSWEEAMSPAAREKVRNWFEGTIYPRREPGASIVVIQTRWHEDDLTGHLLQNSEDRWTRLNFPALAEEGDSLGRAKDAPLCPERYISEDLGVIRRTLGSFKFACLYQQRPAPLEGGVLNRDWFQFWRPESLPVDGRTVISLDPTFKATGSSFVVAQVWRESFPNFYLLDQVRDRMSFLDCCRMVVRLRQKWTDANDVLVEEAANGAAILDTLRSHVPGLRPIRAETSKENRLHAVSGLVESGNVFLPPDASWVDDFLGEVVTFPNSANDDQVDAMTMALRFLSSRARVDELTDIDFSNVGVRASPWKEIQG